MKTLTVPALFVPGDRVALAIDHLDRVGNLWTPGDWGPDARGTVVEMRLRGACLAPTLVVEWDGGSCRNHHPRSLVLVE